MPEIAGFAAVSPPPGKITKRCYCPCRILLCKPCQRSWYNYLVFNEATSRIFRTTPKLQAGGSANLWPISNRVLAAAVNWDYPLGAGLQGL